MEESTKDKIQGGMDETKGKIKEEAGKLTGNEDLQARGTMEKIGGKKVLDDIFAYRSKYGV